MNEIDEILSNIDKEDDKDQDRGPEAGNSVPPDTAIEPPDGDGETDEQAVTEFQVDGLPDGQISIPFEAPEEPAPSRLIEFVPTGTKTWNIREPYTIKINLEAYQKDVADLHKSFYYIPEPTDTETIKQTIKLVIVKFLRKANNNLMDQYSDFICKLISINVQNFTNDFDLNQNNTMLMVYHIGPMTIYKILKEEFQQKKYGFCYKYLPGNKAVRFFPAEFMKRAILQWFEENINPLDLPFDSIQKYEDIKNIAQKKYQSDLRIFNTRFDQVNMKIGADKTISRNKLFQLKGTQWFGFQNIEIYKRFMGNSIFI